MAPRDQSNHLWDSSGQITSTGSANAYVIATAASLTGYIQGMDPIRFKANFGNTASATVNINGIGAATLKKYGGATNLASGDIVSGGIYTLSYDGTNFQVLELQGTAASVTGFPMTVSGDRWGVIAPVGADGVMEVGHYIDFHNSDADATDNANRLETNGGTVGLYETPSGGVLKRIVSAINSTLAQGDVLYYDGTNFVRLAPGTSGQFLQTLGAAANPQWAANITAMTAQATTSGTSFDFTGIPGGTKRITVMLDRVSLSGTDALLVQIGDSGGIETTGYISSGLLDAAGGGSIIATSTAGFVSCAANAARVISAIFTLSRIN